MRHSNAFFSYNDLDVQFFDSVDFFDGSFLFRCGGGFFMHLSQRRFRPRPYVERRWSKPLGNKRPVRICHHHIARGFSYLDSESIPDSKEKEVIEHSQSIVLVVVDQLVSDVQ